MTDERIGERLWIAIDRLPEGDGGVVLRHHATPAFERAELARLVGERCKARGLTLGVARDVGLAERVGAGLVHNPADVPRLLPVSRSAHTLQQAVAAVAAGASLIFLSPLFKTRSHPGQATLSRQLAAEIAAASSVPVIALGGMNEARFAERKDDGFYGWAGIDAWTGIRT